MLKILFIVDSLGPGGRERRSVQLLKALDKISYLNCNLIVLSNVIFYTEIYNLDININIFERKTKKDISILYKIYKLCRSWKPDIIHTWGSMSAVYACPVTKFMKIKFINTMIADAPDKLYRKIFFRSRLTFPFSDIIQANSYAGLKAYNVKKKGCVIYNGFDFKRLDSVKDPDLIRKKYNINCKYIVGMVASFSDYKDYGSYIIAANNILSKRNDITFICVGDGKRIDIIKKIVDNRVGIIFTGRIEDVESVVNIFDVGVLSTYTEGISNSIMEYMALGKPVIATNGGGTKEIVIDGVTGFLMPEKSPSILEEKILYLINNRALRESMGYEGKKQIQEKFNIDIMVNRQIELYRNLIYKKKY